MIEPPVGGAADEQQKLYELLEAVAYAARHDDTVVVIRDGRAQIDRRAESN